MNCDTYLSMLETLPVSELAYGDAATHAATCRDCDRVTRVVAERERNMLLAYGTISPPVATGPLTAHALELSRRRRVAFFYRVALGVAAVVAVLAFAVTRRIRPAVARADVSTIRLRCLSAEQAFEIFRHDGALLDGVSSIRADGSVLRVVGSEEGTARLRAILRLSDNSEVSQCGGAGGGTGGGTGIGIGAATTRATRP